MLQSTAYVAKYFEAQINPKYSELLDVGNETFGTKQALLYCLWDTESQSRNDKREISKVREKSKRIRSVGIYT